MKRRMLHRQSGFTLIELAIATVLAGIALTVGMWYQAQEFSYSIARAQADQLVVLNHVVGTYETNYYNNLENGTPVPGVANSYAPTLAELKSLGLLDTGFSPTNYYNGAYGVTLERVPAGCTPPSCDVAGLTYLTSPILGRDGLVDTSAVGEAMLRAGGDAAYSSVLNPTVLSGPNGSWSKPNPLGGVGGILAMRMGYGAQGFSRFLPRDGSLAMTGSLNIGGNNINNANTVSANTVSANGVNANTVTGTAVTGTSVTASSSLTSSGETYLSSTAAPGGGCWQEGSVRTSSTRSGLVLCHAGVWLPVGTATPNIWTGAGCSIDGQIATDANNVGYLCRSGRYIALNKAIGTLVTLRTITNVTDGMTFAKDNCPTGTAWALYTPTYSLVNVTGYVNPPIEGNYFSAVDGGWYWYAQASGVAPQGGWYSGNDVANLGGQLYGTLTTGCAYN